MHRGAQPAGVNVLFGHAGENQLIAVRSGQVEAHPAIPRRHEPSIDQITLVSCGGERVDDVGADFVAAGADRWADRHDQVGRLTAELTLHFVDRRHGSARRRSAPAGVHGSDRARPRVGDEQWNAIRRTNHECDVGRIRNRCVCLWSFCVRTPQPPTRRVRLDSHHVATVHLIQRQDAIGRDIHRGGERFPGVV